jgi:preprotein translocase subunit SecG
VEIALSVILIITSMVMVLLVLLHKGKGGGLSDLCGVSSTLGSSSVVERNLDRITIFFGVLWFVCVVALGWLINH